MTDESGTEMPIEGVESLDHTADVGLRVRAEDPAELFSRAALGMMHLILEGPLPDAVERRRVQVQGMGADELLRNWLREVLYLHEGEGFAVSESTFHRLDVASASGPRETRLEATVGGGSDPAPPAREIKGVTWHGLSVEERDGWWFAQVIFDV